MRYLSPALTLVLSAMLAGATLADDGAEEGSIKKGNRSGRGPEFREKMLEKFDADGDGKLSEKERETAREARPGRRGERGPREGRGSEGFHPPKPEDFFRQFDKDGDMKLNLEEFRALTESMRAKRQRGGSRHGKGFRQGPSEGRGDRRGPPNEGQRNFRSRRPLENRGDQPGPPPPREGRRGPQGPEGRRRPEPGQIFDRFDQDGNDQLSRDEFFELSEAMRARHERRGPSKKRGFHPDRSEEGRRDFRRTGPPRSERDPVAEEAVEDSE